MSGLQTTCVEKTTPVIARFDDLFTPGGIAFSAENPHMLLHIADSHSDVAPVAPPARSRLEGQTAVALRRCGTHGYRR